MNRPVGSEAILPVIGSQVAKMWCERMVEFGMSMEVVSWSSESGWTNENAVASVVVVNLVERWFLRDWSRWPWYMAIDCGGYCRT